MGLCEPGMWLAPLGAASCRALGRSRGAAALPDCRTQYWRFINVCLSQSSAGNSSGCGGTSSASSPWHLCPGGQQGLGAVRGQQGQGWEPDWPQGLCIGIASFQTWEGGGLVVTWCWICLCLPLSSTSISYGSGTYLLWGICCPFLGYPGGQLTSCPCYPIMAL